MTEELAIEHLEDPHADHDVILMVYKNDRNLTYQYCRTCGYALEDPVEKLTKKNIGEDIFGGDRVNDQKREERLNGHRAWNRRAEE